jgi:hypothetical protein
VLLAKRCLPAEWIIREQPQETDYGIDLEIELALGDVSGRLFKAQVRGHEKVRWNADGTFLEHVRKETLNYWRAIPLPVILLVPDHSAQVTYWSAAKMPDGSSGVRVRKKSALPGDIAALAVHVIDWLDKRGVRALKYGLPFFEEAWLQVRGNVGGDCFLSLEYEQYALLEYVYRQAQLLRDALALPATMLPWSLWLARARVTFGDAEDMYCGTHDEIVEYLRPLVEELLKKGRQELSAEEPNAENAAALRWATSYGVYYRVPTEFDLSPRSFWREVDELLSKRGALKFPAEKGARFSRRRDSPPERNAN